MKFKITYSQGDVINKTYEVTASSRARAMVLFWLDNPEADDVSKVEKVNEDEII